MGKFVVGLIVGADRGSGSGGIVFFHRQRAGGGRRPRTLPGEIHRRRRAVQPDQQGSTQARPFQLYEGRHRRRRGRLPALGLPGLPRFAGRRAGGPTHVLFSSRAAALHGGWHGHRRSGGRDVLESKERHPAERHAQLKDRLSDQEIWQVSAFVTSADKLPPEALVPLQPRTPPAAAPAPHPEIARQGGRV